MSQPPACTLTRHVHFSAWYLTSASMQKKRQQARNAKPTRTLLDINLEEGSQTTIGNFVASQIDDTSHQTTTAPPTPPPKLPNTGAGKSGATRNAKAASAKATAAPRGKRGRPVGSNDASKVSKGKVTGQDSTAQPHDALAGTSKKARKRSLPVLSDTDDTDAPGLLEDDVESLDDAEEDDDYAAQILELKSKQARAKALKKYPVAKAAMAKANALSTD